MLFWDDSVNAEWLCDKDLDVQAKDVHLHGASENHCQSTCFCFRSEVGGLLDDYQRLPAVPFDVLLKQDGQKIDLKDV